MTIRCGRYSRSQEGRPLHYIQGQGISVQRGCDQFPLSGDRQQHPGGAGQRDKGTRIGGCDHPGEY